MSSTELLGLDSIAAPLQQESDLDPLLDRIGDAPLVLLGEASHGTHEYYEWRAAITRRLITEQGFSFVAVEGDWPDCYRLNCAVKGLPGAPTDPLQVLHQFDRWPAWMWANAEVLAFARWLTRHNASQHPEHRVGFYGLDVYSLWDSLRETLGYLQEHEPQHVPSAMAAVRCLEPYAEDPQAYARSTRLVPPGCQDPVVKLLSELRRQPPDETTDREARFNAEQNALVAAGAEAYYRTVVRGGSDSWNLRDTHMADTLDRLLEHHGGDGTAKGVVWEHNTHIGDARATSMADRGLINVGQLVRERHGEENVVLVGFGSFEGTVIAADAWDAPARILEVPPARPNSVEDVLRHGVTPKVGPDALLVFPPKLPSWLTQRCEHRAIGVVYDPEMERRGNYVPTVLGQRYDAFCWFHQTKALQPLHWAGRPGEEETWPFGE